MRGSNGSLCGPTPTAIGRTTSGFRTLFLGSRGRRIVFDGTCLGKAAGAGRKRDCTRFGVLPRIGPNTLGCKHFGPVLRVISLFRSCASSNAKGDTGVMAHASKGRSTCVPGFRGVGGTSMIGALVSMPFIGCGSLCRPFTGGSTHLLTDIIIPNSSCTNARVVVRNKFVGSGGDCITCSGRSARGGKAACCTLKTRNRAVFSKFGGIGDNRSTG